MKENNKSSILISILCGVAVCFACLGIVFLLPAKNTSNLEGNNNLINPNEGEINLGDDTCNYCMTQCTSDCDNACRYACGGGGSTLVCSYGNGGSCYNCTTQNACQNAGCTWTDNVGCGYSGGGGSDPEPETPTTTQCWKLTSGESCSAVTVEGTHCTGTNYTNKDDCIRDLRCGSKYKNGSACYSCDSGTHNIEQDCNGTQATCCEADASSPVDCSSIGDSGSCNSGQAATYCNWCTKTNKCLTKGAACEDPTKECFKLANDVCTKIIVSGDTCNIAENNFPDLLSCQTVLGKKCSDYDSVSECPSYCYWYDSSCNSSPANADDPECVSISSASDCLKRDDCAWDYTNYCHSISLNPKKLIVHGGGVAYVTPSQCKTFTFTALDEKSQLVSASWHVSGGSHVSHTCSTGSYCSVTVCGYDCDSYGVSVSAAYNGLSSNTASISVTAYQEWSEKDWNKEPNSEPYIYNTSALDTYTCIGYSGPYEVDGVTYYKKRYTRCCGSGGSATPAPEVPVVQKTPKCYLDEDNKYHWTADPESGWVIATDKDGLEITNKKLCPPKDACYQNPDGGYEWGEFSTKPGYLYHAEITDKDSCKDDPESACYRKGDDYVWAKTAPEGYEKVNVTYEQCESPACYYSESKKIRIWGYYSKVNGYYRIVDENDNDIPYNQCKEDACYKCSGDKYMWGDYSNDKDCEVLPSVTDIKQCTNEVPVDPTGVSVSTIIYVFMAILMAFGLGFIYYSTMLKKDN